MFSQFEHFAHTRNIFFDRTWEIDKNDFFKNP
jgi:hypothetical protein